MQAGTERAPVKSAEVLLTREGAASEGRRRKREGEPSAAHSALPRPRPLDRNHFSINLGSIRADFDWSRLKAIGESGDEPSERNGTALN